MFGLTVSVGLMHSLLVYMLGQTIIVARAMWEELSALADRQDKGNGQWTDFLTGAYTMILCSGSTFIHALQPPETSLFLGSIRRVSHKGR